MPASLFCMCKHTKERPCEQSEITASTHSEEISPEPNQVGPLSLDFQPLERQEIHFCCLGHPIYGILLFQAELTKTVIIFLETRCHPVHVYTLLLTAPAALALNRTEALSGVMFTEAPENLLSASHWVRCQGP